jgi:hypothetical protein
VFLMSPAWSLPQFAISLSRFDRTKQGHKAIRDGDGCVPWHPGIERCRRSSGRRRPCLHYLSLMEPSSVVPPPSSLLAPAISASGKIRPASLFCGPFGAGDSPPS